MVDVINLVATFATFYGIYTILAISLNLEYGYAGQPNFGQAMFYGIGAFVAAIVAANLLPVLARVPIGDICSTSAYATRVAIGSSDPGFVIPTWIIGLILAMIAGGIFGLFLSYPAIRVKEEWYLSMILLVASEAFIVVIDNTSQIGCGIFGLDGIQNPFTWIHQAFGNSSFASSQLGTDIPGIVYAGIIIGFAGICYFIAQRLVNSPYGRLLKSIRDDAVAAESLGKDVARVRRQIMVIGSIMAGLAGGLYVYYIGVAVPDDYATVITFAIWVILILGGFANNRGILVGSLVLTLLQRGSTEVGIIVQPMIPNFNASVVIYLEYVIEAAILVLLLIYRPKGIIPESKIKTNAYELFDFAKNSSAKNEIKKSISENTSLESANNDSAKMDENEKR